MPHFSLEITMFSDIANRVYQDVQSRQKRGDSKAGIPEGASKELSVALRKLFLSNNTIKWEDVLEVYGENQ